MKSAHSVAELLAAAHRRLCSAVAFVPAVGDDLQIRSAASAAEHTRQIIRKTAAVFLKEAGERREVVIRNRVRELSGGPLIGRFLVAPVVGENNQLVGGVIAYRQANDDPFTTREARWVHRYARLFVQSLAAPSDALTGLPTRTGFEQQIHAQLERDVAHAPSALLYGDIDQLHVINDMWGFEVGDRAIVRVSQELTMRLAPYNAVLSRLSGDRFTAFVPDCTIERSRAIANELRNAVLAMRIETHADPVSLTMSWGVSVLRPGKSAINHGLAAAEIACKAAKDRGRNRVEIYHESDVSIIRRRDDMLIIGRLRYALDEGRFQVFGQPIAPLLKHDDARRYEMPVRVLDENDQLVLPSHFMSAATRYQLLPQLDRCVIHHVLDNLRVASARPGFKPLHVSLNLTGPTISDADFELWLLDELKASGIPGDWVSFELTETAAIGNLERAQSLIDRLSRYGCRFALDDFGTGLSSLAHLKALNFSTLKIDGSFIRDLLVNKRSESLVRAVAQLANSMGMETVAEYVESSELCMRLIELEVQYGQGYAIGRPVRLDRILDPLKKLAQAS